MAAATPAIAVALARLVILTARRVVSSLRARVAIGASAKTSKADNAITISANQ